MSANLKSDALYMTEDEYLEFERDSKSRHEYIDGRLIDHQGESPNHNRIVMSLSILVGSHVRGKDCEAFGGDQRVKIKRDKNYLYPDLSAACGESEFNDDNPQALLNPILVIEVLSSSIGQFDQDEKFMLYRQIDSFREYVLVWQDKAKIARYFLNDENIWEFADANGLESNIRLKSIDCTLSLADVYDNVIFEQKTEESH